MSDADKKPFNPPAVVDPAPPEHDPAEPAAELPERVGLSPDEQARLQALRVQRRAGGVPENDERELEALALRESEAAGHVAPEAAPELTEAQTFAAATLSAIEHTLGAIGYLVDTLPAAAGARQVLAMAHQRLAEARDLLAKT